MENAKEKLRHIIKETKDFFEKTGASGAVLGLSGGIDSATTAYALKEAIGNKRITALIMPEKGVTSEQNVKDAVELAKTIGIRHYVIPITQFLKSYSKMPWKQNKFAGANLKARIRMVILYNYANSNNCLVAGTSNRTELVLGYFTKYGDGAADFLPMASLLKTEVREIAKELCVPKKILEKRPSAELWKGQTDEGELGLSYEEMDTIISRVFDQGLSAEDAANLGIKRDAAHSLLKRAQKNKHKSELPKAI